MTPQEALFVYAFVLGSVAGVALGVAAMGLYHIWHLGEDERRCYWMVT